MKRLLIIGSPGSGKSTLARQLACKTGIPVTHLDKLYWRPGWVEPSKEQWRLQVEDQLEAPAWIMDGNYGGTLERRLQVADEVILLDLPRWLCLWRTIKRIVSGWGQTRPDMAEGCPERFDLAFLLYIWSFRSRHLPATMQLLEHYNGKVTILRSGQKIQAFADSYSTIPETTS